MTRKALKTVAVVLPVVFALAALTAFFPGGRSASNTDTITPGTRVTLGFTNNVGVEVCGLQVEFNLPPEQVLDQIKGITAFRTVITMIAGNVVYFTDGCVSPGGKVELQLAPTASLAVIDYYWVKDRTLIPGAAPLERRIETVTIDKLALLKDRPEPPAVTVRFTLSNPPYGKLLVAQGDAIYENGLLAIKDQPRRDELLAQLAGVKRENLRRKLEAEIAALEVRAPVSGVVKELKVEMGEGGTTVTLKIVQEGVQ